MDRTKRPALKPGSFRKVLHHSFDASQLEKLSELSEIVPYHFADHLLKYFNGYIEIIPEYLVDKLKVPPYKKTMTLCFFGDTIKLEKWLQVVADINQLLLGGHFGLSFEIEIAPNVASAQLLLPKEKSPIELVESCQYIRNISNQRLMIWEGVMMIKFGFPIGCFETEIDKRWNKKVEPRDKKLVIQ